MRESFEKEKSKLRTLLWLIFPLGLLIGCIRFGAFDMHIPNGMPFSTMVERSLSDWGLTIAVLTVSLALSIAYFFSRKKAVGIIAVIVAFLGVMGVVVGEIRVPSPSEMRQLVDASWIFSIPGIRNVMLGLISLFDTRSQILGRYIWEWVYTGAIYALPALFVLVFYLRTKRCVKRATVEANSTAQSQQTSSANQQVAEMQAQLAQMRAEMERMKAGQTEKATETIQTAQVEEAAPSAPEETRTEAVAAPAMPVEEKKAVAPAMPVEENKTVAAAKPFSLSWKWVIAAVVALLFILFSTRAFAFVSIDAYIQKCIAIAAVWCIATRKRRSGIVLAIVYAALSAYGFLGTLASVSYRASLLDTGIKLLLYFKTLGSLIAVAPILYFAFVPRRGKGLLKVLCGITVAVFAAEIAINLFALGSVSSLIPCTALNYAFCAAAAFAVGESANVAKKEKQKKASSHSLFKKAFAYFKDEEKVENLGERSKVVAALLAWFLGAFGAHRYYLGYKKRGMLMSIGAGCLVLGTILMTIATTGATMGAVNAALSRKSSGGIGFAVLSVLSIPLLLAGAATGIMALVDFIRILMNTLLPADGKPYQNGVVVVQSTANNPNNNIEALEKLAKLHEQGILTDEEFQQKKTEILGKM